MALRRRRQPVRSGIAALQATRRAACTCARSPRRPGCRDLLAALKDHVALDSAGYGLPATAQLLQRLYNFQRKQRLDTYRDANKSPVQRSRPALCHADELHVASVHMLEALSVSLQPTSTGFSTADTGALCELLRWSGKLSSSHGTDAPQSLRTALTRALISREDQLDGSTVVQVAQAAVSGFEGPLPPEARNELTTVMAMVARRVEYLSARSHGPAACELGDLCSLAWCFAKLQTYNSRLFEDVLTSALVKAAHSPTAIHMSDYALAKLCWAVGRLAPPLPDLVRLYIIVSVLFRCSQLCAFVA